MQTRISTESQLVGEVQDGGMKIPLYVDTLFTQALKHPGLLSRQPDYISCNERFIQTPTTTDLNGQNVIVVYRVLDRVKITWLLILLLFVSPGLGVLVGLRSHKAEVGIAVSAAVFALASVFKVSRLGRALLRRVFCVPSLYRRNAACIVC